MLPVCKYLTSHILIMPDCIFLKKKTKIIVSTYNFVSFIYLLVFIKVQVICINVTTFKFPIDFRSKHLVQVFSPLLEPQH